MAANPYEPAATFHSALRSFLHESEVAARSESLTPRQYVLLLQIGAAGQTTVSELVALLALTQSTVTELVQRAVRGGLVTRTPSPSDARVVHLRLTGEGRERLQRVSDRLGGERHRLRAVIDDLGPG
ncbi:MAG TPA: MarR family transcriptional regulator [Gaiellaceae bacterium]|jgi:DNA-binding MarR family transcriptional regulator